MEPFFCSQRRLERRLIIAGKRRSSNSFPQRPPHLTSLQQSFTYSHVNSDSHCRRGRRRRATLLLPSENTNPNVFNLSAITEPSQTEQSAPEHVDLHQLQLSKNNVVDLEPISENTTKKQVSTTHFRLNNCQNSIGSIHVDRDVDRQQLQSKLVNVRNKSTNRTPIPVANTPNRIPLRQISPVISRNNTFYSHDSRNLSPVTPVFGSHNSTSNVSDLSTIQNTHHYSSTKNGNIVTNWSSRSSGHYSPNVSAVTPVFDRGNSTSNVSGFANIITNCSSTNYGEGHSCITNSTTSKAILKSSSNTATTGKYVPDYPFRRGFSKKRRKAFDSIPRFDLSSAENDVNNKFTGISREYLDLGDPVHCCKTCKAMLWYDEATTNNPYLSKSGFSLCCGGGKVELPNLKEPPSMLLDLYSGRHPSGKEFVDNIRRYNMMFSFTSMGAKVDHRINSRPGPYIYKIHGQNYHCIGDLVPQEGQPPKFCQLYIYDTENEIDNRFGAFDGIDQNELPMKDIQSTPFWISHQLKGLLDEINPLVKQFRMARDRIDFNQTDDIKLILIGRRDQDGRCYNLPTASEVAALIVGDIDGIDKQDILLEKHTGRLQRINELHPSYLALQYPLLFPYAEDGFREEILHRAVKEASTSKRDKLTLREFFAYRLQQRTNEVSLMLMARRLFQQFVVDAYTMVESQRLSYLKFNQKKLRICTENNLKNSRNEGNSDGSKYGNRFVIPSSFTGGTRYMKQNYLDAMTLCKWYGYPDLFITITCNPKWPEILRFLEQHGLKAEDRPDITTRMFKMKLDMLISDMKDKKIIGPVTSIIYTAEFQKRGLPHCHICLFLEHKIANPQEADRFISAEIPDIDDDRQLYELVSEFMMHGPCGADNPKFYKRRDDGNKVKKGNKWLDNRNVVGYNGTLLRRYQSHINVEWCNQVGSIKYLFKYVNKGPDRITAAVSRQNKNRSQTSNQEKYEEFEQWYDCRYLSACEACWRIFAFDIHYRTPSIERLSFHVESGQPIVYDGEEAIEDVLDKPSVGRSQFLGWFEANKKYPSARSLTYGQFPTKFVWNIGSNRKWTPREKGYAIGRIHHVPPKVGDLYYLRILLNIVKGATCYEDIKTVDGKLYNSFKDTCHGLGLLDDDNEYILCIQETNQWASAEYCRYIFVMLITLDSLARPEHVWNETWEIMSEDINYKRRVETGIPDLNLSPEALKNHALASIERMLVSNGSSLKHIPTMPYPDYAVIQESCNMLIHHEICYDQQIMSDLHDTLFSTMTDEQKDVYNRVMCNSRIFISSFLCIIGLM